MKMLAWAAVGLSALLACLAPAPAAAQHAGSSAAPAGYAPEQACITWSGGSIGAGLLVPCGTTTDPANASYLFGISSSATSNTFATAGRGLDALCTVAGTVTLTDTAGGTRSVQLAVGYQYFPFAVKSYASLTGTCTLGVLL
jgi:hypothetical protein